MSGQLSIRLPVEIDRRIEIIAVKCGLSKADVIRQALRQMLPDFEARGILIPLDSPVFTELPMAANFVRRDEDPAVAPQPNGGR